jgi:CRP/FNR family cyclic AMP-dependent transcriptional regulator
MAWRAGDIEEMVMKRPQLAMALLQAFGQRALGFTERIESLSVDSIDQRLARALVRFSERLGTPQTDGSVHMEPLTHELLAQYVGTSRELVTCRMTNFRRQGYLQYSRKGITLYRDALRAWLRDSN